MTALCGLTFQFFFTHECEALKMKEIMDFLKEEGISPKLIQEVQEFSAAHPVKEELNGRIPVPHFYYYGKKVWEEALAALLCGKNLLLSGEKPRGKMYLRKIWQQFSAVLPGTSHFM